MGILRLFRHCQNETVETVEVGPDEAQRISDVVASMPERTRQAVTLRKVYGYSDGEIGERLQISSREVACELEAAARIFGKLFDDPPPQRHGRLH